MPPDVPENDDRVAIKRATEALLNAVNKSDLPGVVDIWADDGVLMPPHHPGVHGRIEIQRYFSRLFQQSRFTFSFPKSSIEVTGDLALERLEYSATMSPLGGGQAISDVGKGLHVFRRQPSGSWQLIMDIWNSDHPASR
jgi:ketosteroid isomerase-like protein